MKKVLLTAAVVLAACMSTFAQEKTKGTVMSRENAFDYGLYYGNGDRNVANFAGAVLDYNFKNTNFRLRGQGGLMELPNCPALAVDAQYLFKTIGNLYLYPTAGAYGEYHNKKSYGDDKWCQGLQAGIGAEYQFSSRFGLFVQGRRQFLFGNETDRTTVDGGFICHIGKHNRGDKVRAAFAAAEAERLAAEAAAAKAEAERLAAERAAAEKAAADAEAARLAAEKAAAEQAAAEAAARAAARATVENVYFKLNKSNIRKSEEDKIANIVSLMNQYPEAQVTVSGYADKKTGTPKRNLKLSEERANNVKQALVDAGIDSQRIVTAFYGDTVQPYEVNEENRVAVMVTK